MEIMAVGRRQGKTTEVVKRLRENPDAVLVVSTHREAGVIGKNHPDVAHQIYSANSPERLRGMHPSEVYVDNIDMVVASLLGYPVSFATVTTETEHVADKTWWNEAADIASNVYSHVYEKTKDHDLAWKVAIKASDQFMERAVDW